jgi:hypothetical protein
VAGSNEQRPRLAEPGLYADRVHTYAAPIALLFAALTVEEAMWWVDWLQPGEVRPRVLEAEPFRRVVWSSLWPVSPDDTIEFDLSESAENRYMSAGELADDKPTAIRFRWYSAFPPDARGIAITRQRLNRKLGGDLRAVVSEYYWQGPSGTTPITVQGQVVQVPVITLPTRPQGTP